MVLNDGPLGFTINGKSFPATAPLVASKGDLVRIRYMNEGLQIHPMHLHGIPQKADFYTAKLEGELGEPETKPISYEALAAADFACDLTVEFECDGLSSPFSSSLAFDC